MYATSVFIYTQRQIVVLLTGYSVRKYMPVYAKPLTLHKGVDNQLQFQFLNQEQKPVDITGKEITCRILNYQGNQTLIQKGLTVQLGLTGIASLYITPAELENIDAQKAYYTLEIPVGEFDFPVFVDQNAGARGDMNIVNSVLPNFVPSMEVSIPSGQLFPNNNSNIGNTITYNSSTITTDDNPIITFQVKYDQYYGNVAILGSTVGSGQWYPIRSEEYANVTETLGYVIKGFHPYMKLEFNSNAGIVTNILAR